MRRWLPGILLLLAFWTFVGVSTWRDMAPIREITAVSDVVAADPTPLASSGTGYEHETRRLIVGRHADAMPWIMQAQHVVAQGDPRVRFTDYDNAPAGREVHWAMPTRLWLIAVGWGVHVIEDVPLALGIERAALFSNPLLYALLGAALLIWALRSSGQSAAIAATLALIGLTPLREPFVAGNADHHGFAVAAVFVLLLALHRALRPPEATNTASHGDHRGGRAAILSGVAGGIGLWISAATVLPVLAAIGVGAVLSFFFRRLPGGRNTAAVWRTWAWSGGATSLACYLAEYAPHHFGLRLEVNHPLHALAWMGAGEVLALLTERKESAAAPVPWARWILASSALLLLPAVFLLTAPESFWLRDSLLWRLHRDYIIEFQPLWRITVDAGDVVVTVAALLPCLLALVFAIRHVRVSAAAETRTAWLGLLAPLVLTGVLSLWQVRWASTFGAASLSVLLRLLPDARLAKANMDGSPAQTRQIRWLLAALVPAVLLAILMLPRKPAGISRDDMLRLAERSLAFRLRQRIGDNEPGIILTSPRLTNAFAFHGSLRGLGSLYWENLPGLRRAAEIFAATDTAEAHRLMLTAGISHLVVASWDGFEPHYVRLARGLDRNAPAPEDAFILQLIQQGKVPAWLRPVAYRLPEHDAYAGERVWIFEVVPPRPAARVIIDAADYHLEMREPAAARALEAELRRHADSVAALVTLGRMVERTEASQTLLPRIERLLAEGASLQLDDRIRLAHLAAHLGRTLFAREQLLQCQSEVDESAARHLSAETLATLVVLSDALGVPLDPARAPFLRKLLPPYLNAAAVNTDRG